MYKSNIEDYFASCCKKLNINFVYEGNSFVLLEKEKINFLSEKRGKSSGEFTTFSTSRQIKYTPDFILHDHKWIVEIKGTIYQDRSFPLVTKLFLRFLKNNPQWGQYRFVIIRTKKGVDNFFKNVLLYGGDKNKSKACKKGEKKQEDKKVKKAEKA